jgi:hypothetical protein
MHAVMSWQCRACNQVIRATLPLRASITPCCDKQRVVAAVLTCAALHAGVRGRCLLALHARCCATVHRQSIAQQTEAAGVCEHISAAALCAPGGVATAHNNATCVGACAAVINTSCIQNHDGGNMVVALAGSGWRHLYAATPPVAAVLMTRSGQTHTFGCYGPCTQAKHAHTRYHHEMRGMRCYSCSGSCHNTLACHSTAQHACSDGIPPT